MAIFEQQTSSPYLGRRMTLDEFLKLPEEDGSLEFDQGLVTQKVAPQADHGSLQPFLWDALNSAGRRTGVGVAFTETRFVTEGWAPVPDVCFYRKERINVLGGRRIEDFKGPPDIAAEIASPDQRISALLRKCARYIDVGTRLVILIDPDDESVFVFRPDQRMQVLRGDDRIDLDDVLPGFALTVRSLFEAIVPDLLRAAGDKGSPDEDE